MIALRTTAVVAAVYLLSFQPASSQVPPSADQIARFRAAAEPGPEHRMLAGLSGEWDQVVRGWPAPGADPFEAKGRASSRMLLGGRFLESASDVEVMGQPAPSISILGFDRRSGLFTVILLDTQGTYWVTATGPAAADGRGGAPFRAVEVVSTRRPS